MSLQPVKSVLWRRVNKATIDTLIGESDGQYHIALPDRPALADFFAGLERTAPNDRGGFVMQAPLAAYDGPASVPAQDLPVRYLGDQSARRDWNFSSQRPATAYPLWRVGRAFEKPTNEAAYRQLEEHFVVLCRDLDDRYHARWLTPADCAALPEGLRTALAGDEIGVYVPDQPLSVSLDARRITERLLKFHNVLLYGPPGTGKSFVMQEVANLFSGSVLVIDTEGEHDALKVLGHTDAVRWVTFHQSYSYEEFVVGLRSDASGDKLLNLKPQAGVLLEAAASALGGSPSLLLVDELNRGNVSRIFGEFITLMEPDKRLMPDGTAGPSSVRVRLPYLAPGESLAVKTGSGTAEVRSPFEMPHGLYTLATMNSLDKSVAPLDSALRRRFHVILLEPNLAGLATHFGMSFDSTQRLASPPQSLDEVRQLALQVLYCLNERVKSLLGADYCLGQWYLTPVFKAASFEDAKAALDEVFQHRLLPQLRELFHGRADRLAWVLCLGGDVDSPVYLVEPDDTLLSLGGAVRVDTRDVSRDQLLSYLSGITPSD